MIVLLSLLLFTLFVAVVCLFLRGAACLDDDGEDHAIGGEAAHPSAFQQEQP